MNNMWGQLLRQTPVRDIEAPVTAKRGLGNELKEGCARRRPRGFRADDIRPIKPDASHVVGGVNRWDLTTQQFTVIAMMAQGAKRHAVADELHISYKTLNQHLNRVRERMEVKTVDEAVAKYLRENMVRDLEKRRAHANEMLIFKLRRLGIKLP